MVSGSVLVYLCIYTSSSKGKLFPHHLFKVLQHTQHLQMQVFQCFIGVMFSVLFSVKIGGERVLFSSTVIYILVLLCMCV